MCAELSYVVQLVLDVAAVTCTVRLAPDTRVIGWPTSVRCWAPSAPEIANEAGSPVVPSIVQCTGVNALPPGNASVNVTPVALPGPGFDTVTVNPIAVPDDTDAASAVLVT